MLKHMVCWLVNHWANKIITSKKADDTPLSWVQNDILCVCVNNGEKQTIIIFQNIIFEHDFFKKKNIFLIMIKIRI